MMFGIRGLRGSSETGAKTELPLTAWEAGMEMLEAEEKFAQTVRFKFLCAECQELTDQIKKLVGSRGRTFRRNASGLAP